MKNSGSFRDSLRGFYRRIVLEPKLCCNQNTYKVNGFRHFDLGEDSAPEIRGEFAGVANLESVRTFHDDFHRFATVELGHSLDFAESHKVSVLKPVPCLVQASDYCVFSLELYETELSLRNYD
jgi:hypothetical protein